MTAPEMIPAILKRFDYKLLLLFIILGTILILKTYFDPNGGVTPDSGYYLQLANSLLNGNGFQVISYTSPEDRELFAIWPVGYPILICVVSKLTGLSVFWASKVLNVLCIGLCLMVLKIIFRNYAHWAGLIFFVDSFLHIFSYTWSEGPFMFFCLVFCLSIYKSLKTSGKISWLIYLFFSGLALFFIRYIGCFSLGIVGFIAIIYLAKKRWDLSLKLLSVLLIQSLVIGLYLFNNKLATGYLTGRPRSILADTQREFIRPLLIALKEELSLIDIWPPYLSIIITLILLALLGIYLYETRKSSFQYGINNGIWKYFAFTAFLYFISVNILVWMSNVEDINYRYLAPASFLFLLSIAAYLQGKPKIRYKHSNLIYLLIIAILGLHLCPGTYIIYKNIRTKGNIPYPNYPDNIRSLEEKYRSLRPNSIVIYGSDHLRYLKNDVIPTDIYTQSTLDEMVNYFKRSGTGNWNVYIEIKDDLDPARYHQSIIDFVNANQDKQLVRME